MDPQPSSAEIVEDDAASTGGPPRESGTRGDRLALIAFVAFELVAFPVILLGPGRDQWFRFADDWDFLALRDSLLLSDLLAPHNGHWTTLPLLVYRAIYHYAGLDYLPYEIVLVVLHLTVAALLRAVIRRCGVGPWISTAAAAVLVLFGPGADNIVWSFQITFVAALALGLTQLLLADHEGGVDRRDWLALVAGALALMCSGAGPVMVLVVGIAMLMRHGWRRAALQTVPLGIVYASWYLTHFDTIQDQTAVYRDGPYGPVELVTFVWAGIRSTFAAVGSHPVVGVALAVLLVVGLALAWTPLDRAAFRRQAGIPVALLVGGLVFLAVTGQQRALYGSGHAAESRYVYLLALFVLPALAVAAEAVARRWRWAGPVVIVLLLVGVPRNALTFDDATPNLNAAIFDEERTVLLAAPRSPQAADVPGWLAPEPSLAPGVTMGWLRRAASSGELPEPRALEPADQAQLAVRLGVAQLSGPRLLATDVSGCRESTEPIEITPAPGTILRSDTTLAIVPLADGKPAAPAVKYRPIGDRVVLQVVLPDLHLRVATMTGQQAFEVCG